MKAIIYGNGPSLLTAPLRESNVTRFGVNRSYEVAYAENWVTADARAFVNRYEWKWPGGSPQSNIHVRSHVFRHVWREPVHVPENLYIWNKGPAGQSGSLAMYVAAQQGFDKIYLVGFCDGGGRRFYEEKRAEEAPFPGYYRRETLKQIWEWPKVDWRIWRDAWHDAEEVLRDEGG